MQEYTRSDMAMLGDMLERLGMLELQRAIVASAEWNEEIAKELQ
jgi:hypothetical protein